jgi:cytochrome c oxidase assembly protein subunit 15
MTIITWLPDHVDARVRAIGWLSLTAQTAIVATGGLVRLTASGLGCPTWPTCTTDSLINTPEMGVHGIIEFGNRLLTFVLIIIAIVAFLFVVRMRHQRKDLFWLALLMGLGIPAQALVGGVSVLTQLNPYVVGVHFVVSIGLVILATIFLQRIYTVPGARVPAVPSWYARVAVSMAFFAAVTICVGILTTGSGPHAGDADAPRNGLNSELLQHLHSWAGYITFALTVVLVIGSVAMKNNSVRQWVRVLLAVEIIQIFVGVLQANTGLPVLVGIHMVLACALTATATAVLLNCTTSAEKPVTAYLQSAPQSKTPYASVDAK